GFTFRYWPWHGGPRRRGRLKILHETDPVAGGDPNPSTSNYGCTPFANVDRRLVRAGEQTARQRSIPAGTHARAAAALQLGLCRLRKDSASGRGSAPAAHA